ncbi:MAG: HAMP domain-containing methyl-accepting chemotaxis protein [Roseovarius sp.]|nr:HAMP domain-containing methyl-accepting chemotaxis protein [Roseovarius sp.]
MSTSLKMSTRVHSLSGFLLLLLVLGGTAGVLSARYASMLFAGYEKAAEKEMLLGRLSEDFLKLNISMLEYRENADTVTEERVRGLLSNILAGTSEKASIGDVKFLNTLSETRQSALAYVETFDRARAASPALREHLVATELAPLGQGALERLFAVRESGREDLHNLGAAGLSDMARIQTAIIAAVAVCFVVGLIFAIWMGRAITRPVQRLRQSVMRIAQHRGDIVIADTWGGDEIGEVGKELASLQGRLLKADRDAAERLADAEADKIAAAKHRARYASMSDAVRDVLAKLARGDLTVRLPDIDADEVPEEYPAIRSDFNQAVERIETVISELSLTAKTVQGGAGEIRQTAQDLSSRTESQAAAIEELAASLDALTRNQGASAKHAGIVAHTVRENCQNAEHTSEIVRETVDAMSGISESSDQIARIIGVIDDIAFQTNLLALNAGVEAARAGEAGKGFAVVASEVRTLAQRASGSAREIKELISTSSEKVQHGVDLVGRTGKALEAMVSGVQGVADQVSEIAKASSEQATGFGEVNEEITQFDKAVQQNAAQAEQSTAASALLDAEASQLLRYVDQFRVRVTPERTVNTTHAAKSAKAADSVGKIVAMKPRAQRAACAQKSSPDVKLAVATKPTSPTAGDQAGIWQDF